jgi:hypothetical protein
MEKRDTLTKILAVAGTVLVGLPLVAPLVFGLIALFAMGVFRFDYLMPAELFPLVLLGGGTLIWAAFRTKRWLRLIGGCIATAVALLVGSQLLATLTGLASGAIEPQGIWWALALGGILLSDLAVLGAAVGGALLLRDLFKPSAQPAASS